jgi:enoyl-CoA hydratase/carnithine racemase
MSEVTLERVGHTSLITIARPEARNALTLPVLRTIREALEAAARDVDVRCVALTGAGGHFCAGADLRKNLDDPDMLQNLPFYMDEFHGVIRGLVRCPKPTIAIVDGAAVGFGADMAFACDLRVVSTTAYVQEKFVSLGLMPDGGGTFWLPRLVGTARAMQLILLAEKLDGAKMVELGIATMAVPSEHLREAAMALAARIESGPPLAYAAIKRAVYDGLGSLEDALRREREGQLELLRTQDLLEGVMAWAQKREPSFQGK